MRRNSPTIVLLAATLLFLGSGLAAGADEELTPPTLKPSACAKIQEQVNNVAKISQSTAISDQDKISMLSKSWAESIASMQDKAKNDDEMAKMVGDLSKAMGQVLALALVPGADPTKDVSPEAKAAFGDVKKQIKPYVAFMKMLCPNLILPPEVSK